VEVQIHAFLNSMILGGELSASRPDEEKNEYIYNTKVMMMMT